MERYPEAMSAISLLPEVHHFNPPKNQTHKNNLDLLVLGEDFLQDEQKEIGIQRPLVHLTSARQQVHKQLTRALS